jgi:hypothetical protein
MNLIIPSWSPKRAADLVVQLGNTGANIIPVLKPGLGCLSAMARGANRTETGHLFFIHDDTFLLDTNWCFLLENFFQANPKCGLVGLGGARKFGSPVIYKKKYELIQLIRYDFISNMKEYQIHGTLCKTPQRVAFVDGFAMCFRREAYEEMGGWERLKEKGLPEFHGYDMLACVEMAKLGWEVWMMPIYCHHEGGRTSTTKEYERFVRRQGFKDGQELFEKAHRVCYNEGKGVLPIWV